MIEILKPRIKVEPSNGAAAKFVVEPLERGFGYTLGNSLRRALISYLPGAAITSVRIEGMTHEFATIPGVREDVTEIVLNLKELIIRLHEGDGALLRLTVKGPKQVTAADIVCPSEAEIINQDSYLFTLAKGSALEMEMSVERGRGYVSADRNKKTSAAIGVIPIDSLFSPTKRVSYSVGNTRVGQRTDYDKLSLDVVTDGSLTPKEAMSLAAKVIRDHLELFDEEITEGIEGPVFVTGEETRDKTLDTPVEDLDLSVRSYNCLKRQGIDTLEDLVDNTESDLMNIKNFGTKSIDEVKDKLAKLQLNLKT